MQFCTQCGKQNEDDSLFCISCGQRLDPPMAFAQPEFDAPAMAAPVAEAAPAYTPAPEPFTIPAYTPEPEPAPMPAPEPEPEPAPVATSIPEPMVQATMELFAAPAAVSSEPAHAASGEPAFSPAHAVTSEPEADDEPEEPAAEPEAVEEPAATPDEPAAEQAGALPEELGAFADRLASIQETVESLSKRFDDKIARNEHEATVLKNMSDEMQEYRDGLYAKLTTPLVRDLIEAREALGSALTRNEQAPDAAQLAADVALARDLIADALARNQVEIVTSQEGDEFASFKHKIVGKVHTDDASAQGKVAEVSGASYKLGEQFIAPAMVKVYTTEDVSE